MRVSTRVTRTRPVWSVRDVTKFLAALAALFAFVGMVAALHTSAGYTTPVTTSTTVPATTDPDAAYVHPCQFSQANPLRPTAPPPCANDYLTPHERHLLEDEDPPFTPGTADGGECANCAQGGKR